MNAPNYKRTKLACYMAYFTMASIFCLPPLLFVTFHTLYDISYTLLGTLVLTNFCTQLGIDLLFTFFAKRFPIGKVVRIMPLITSFGLLIYALIPSLFPQYAYGGLLIGTVLFSVPAGLSEVLLSPVIAAIPSDNPQKDMSLLHSLYAFGVFTIVCISTVFLKLFGSDNWMYLTAFLALLPVFAAVLFMLSPMPSMEETHSAASKGGSKHRNIGLALCVLCIFLGSCAENTMSNWTSGYIEKALHLDKTLGDILGVAMFAVLLGLARIGYAKFGKNICKTLVIGMIGAAGCYIVAGLSANGMVGLVACAMAGLFTGMLWPGTLILMEEKIPGAGVTAFALMAAGGDLGASVAPQLMGVVIDRVTASAWAIELGAKLHLSGEQVGMKVGMLVSSLFPILGIALLLVIIRFFRKYKIA